MGNKMYRKYTGEHSATQCCVTDWGLALRTQQCTTSCYQMF